jgi:hypothetical protein
VPAANATPPGRARFRVFVFDLVSNITSFSSASSPRFRFRLRGAERSGAASA